MISSLFVSLRFRLILLALSAILPILVLITFTAFQQRERAIVDAGHDVEQLGRLTASDHAQLLETARQFLAGVTASSAIRSLSPNECSVFLAELSVSFPHYSNLGAALPNGDVFCSAVPLTGPVSVADRPFFLNAITAREFAVGEYQVGRVTGRPTMQFAQPVLDPSNNRVIAVVFAALDLQWLTDFADLALTRLPENSTLSVLDNQGTVLVHYPNPEQWVGKSAEGTVLLRTLLAQRGEKTATVPGLDGITRIFSFAKLKGVSQASFAYLSIGVPHDAVVSTIDRELTRNLLVVFLVSLLSMGGAWLLGDLFVFLKLKTLTNVVEEMSKGNLAIRTRFRKGRGELDSLGVAFDDMTEKLGRAYSGLEQKVREKTWEFEQEKARAESVLFSLGEALVVTDKDSRVVLVNRAFENLMGWRLNEVLGKPIAEVIAATDAEGNPIPDAQRPRFRPREQDRERVRDDVAPPTGYWYARRDGSRFPVSTTITPIVFFDNEIIGAVEAFRDVTQEWEIDRAKTEFVSLASHQLRTPLSTIRWYVEMLMAGDAGKLSAQQRSYLDEVEQANHRMIDLVNALLNVSRIELGTFSIEVEPTNIAELAKQALHELAPAIREKRIMVKTAIGAGIPTIPGDSRLLRIIFQNLLSNAVKYTPPGGRVGLVIAQEGEEIQITVSDTGWGIPRDQHSRIFTKLFRAANIRDKEPDGTGLGLYIVKSILDHSGGTISFVSKENKGTTFTVRLPLSGMRAREGPKKLA